MYHQGTLQLSKKLLNDNMFDDFVDIFNSQKLKIKNEEDLPEKLLDKLWYHKHREAIVKDSMVVKGATLNDFVIPDLNTMNYCKELIL